MLGRTDLSQCVLCGPGTLDSVLGRLPNMDIYDMRNMQDMQLCLADSRRGANDSHQAQSGKGYK